ncbi:MAG: Zn-ribbon domain-containing OB-fold protein [Gammaproteobacteria bacterium]
MSNFPPPVPAITDVSRPFWQAAREHRLEIQRCDDCGEWIFYPRQVCSECLSSALSWRQVSGLGSVYSYTILHVPPHPGLADELPLIVAVVKLDEGPQLTTNIVDCPPQNLTVDMPVSACFDDVDDNTTLVKFRPV